MTDDMELTIDLLALASHPHDVAGAQVTMRQAADRISALTVERERLRELLDAVTTEYESSLYAHGIHEGRECTRNARAALKGHDHG